MAKIKCDNCGEKADKQDVFIFEGITYCPDCSISLIYRLAERGTLTLEHTEDGIFVEL